MNEMSDDPKLMDLKIRKFPAKWILVMDCHPVISSLEKVDGKLKANLEWPI